MTKVKSGDKVSVHYTGTLENGDIFDSSRERDPMKFEVGSGQLIPGFDKAMIDMEVGQTKTVNIPSAEAYGDGDERNVIPMPRANFSEDMKLEIGLQLELQNDQGQVFPVVVTAIGEEEVTLDANHPLAGKNLTFEIELIEIGVELDEPEHHHHHDHEDGEHCGSCDCGTDND